MLELSYRFQTFSNYSFSNSLYLYQRVSMSILSIAMFVYIGLSILVCQNCPTDFILGMMIPNTITYNEESAATR